MTGVFWKAFPHSSRTIEARSYLPVERPSARLVLNRHLGCGRDPRSGMHPSYHNRRHIAARESISRESISFDLGPVPFSTCVRCASAVLFVIGGSLVPVVGTVCLGRRDSHADPGAVATQFSNSTRTGTSPQLTTIGIPPRCSSGRLWELGFRSPPRLVVSEMLRRLDRAGQLGCWPGAATAQTRFSAPVRSPPELPELASRLEGQSAWPPCAGPPGGRRRGPPTFLPVGDSY